MNNASDENSLLGSYKPAHSDFLIHWTGGKDIDQKFDPDWFKNPSSKTLNAHVQDYYIKRLKDILRYGLWMTKNEEDKYILINNKKVNRPWIARTCFTELRLSDARDHARKFGRLGIGVKRFFLFNRLGAPVTYYCKDRNNWLSPPLLATQDNEDYDDNMFASCFMKQIYRKHTCGKESSLVYDYYDESEWRIIYSSEICKRVKKKTDEDISCYFKTPPEFNMFSSVQNDGEVKPDYVIPLDGWFAMIIYPSLVIKNRALGDSEIRELIEKVKKKGGAPDTENKSSPLEIDLDACRNF